MCADAVTKATTMAEKIEMFAGWDWDSSVIVGPEMNQHLPNRCTVVVHDDKVERVFTESEVRAMLVNITHECGCYEHRGDPVFATRVDDINHIAAKHGIELNTA